MNLCSFTGYLTENPKLSNLNGVSLVEFTLVVYSYRKTKSTGEKSRIPTFLNCEAWHTGGETINRFAKKGSKLHIHASARNPAKGQAGIIFRVNEFDFANNLEEE
jgi:single-stranded DNA-binding protein